MPSSEKFYLTTPIYYVNARPHIGHAYTTIVGDVIARRHRLLGHDTWFLTGTDEHGQKIERSAQAAGVPPQQFTDEVSKSFEDLWKRMGITNDAYIRTTSEKHKRGAQKLFSELYALGKIYLSSYTGQYSIGEEMFVEGPPGTIGPDGRPTETVTEENFFFKLSEYQLPLLNLIESNELVITPESSRNEVLSFLRGADAYNTSGTAERGTTALGMPYVVGALRDLSVSRSSFTWGIPVPEPAASETKQKHVIYVWLDALANYMTAVGYGSEDAKDQEMFARFWPADLHLVGKEITRFHCIYWPAFLMAAGIPVPKAITANGWLLFDNSKMSKSKGNVVRTETILDGFGTEVYAKQFPDSSKQEQEFFASDILRYFLLREIPYGQDGSFSFDAMITRYNSDLANGYGNLVSRTLAMIQKYSESIIPAPTQYEPDGLPPHAYDYFFGALSGPEYRPSVGPLEYGLNTAFENYDFTRVTENLWWAIAGTDSFLSSNAPWKMPEGSGRDDVLYTAIESIRIVTALLHPVLPIATAKVWAQLGLGDIEEAARNGKLKDLKWGGLKPGTKLGPLAPIFPRADKGLAQIMSDMEEAKNKPAVSKLIDESNSAPAVPADSTHPAAGPRAISEPDAHAHVAGSAAITTERPASPSHSEAAASGIFAAQPADASPQITIDDFAKIELRVAQVLVCERIPKADKLLRLEVDLGYEKRQILSGIAEWYTPEELIGRKIVVITNLAPRKMRGLESHGMLLAASEGEGGKPVLATFGEEIAVGSRLK